MPAPTLQLSFDPEADALLSRDPLALLIGMVLDQQIPLEKAFSSPAELKRRLGGKLDVRAIARMDPATLVELFSRPPALHRYPASMAARVQSLCTLLIDEYDGEPTKVWADVPDASELLTRLKALPGFGEQKARIFLALLGKQLGVRPKGWQEQSAPFGESGSHRSVADIVDKASLDEVRAYKAALKAAAKQKAAPGPKRAAKKVGAKTSKG
jgi:uncharacterized HhH-GPD family protein